MKRFLSVREKERREGLRLIFARVFVLLPRRRRRKRRAVEVKKREERAREEVRVEKSGGSSLFASSAFLSSSLALRLFLLLYTPPSFRFRLLCGHYELLVAFHELAVKKTRE